MESFEAGFQAALLDLFKWRRDVRHFRPQPLPDGVLEELVLATRFSPSVGYAQPWRFVCVRSPARRQAVIASFEQANAGALASYAGEEARLYASLKLAGLREAPEHVAVFCDSATSTGRGLGRQTMPQMLEYSAVMAVYTFWLLARARGIGVGWVSILEPDAVQDALDVPPEWRLVAYLCVGYPKAHSPVPELARAGWEAHDSRSVVLEER